MKHVGNLYRSKQYKDKYVWMKKMRPKILFTRAL